ncbi:MAG: aspartate aminotransferase family protein [Flavobacteriales bacterium]|nr:aspartate aminotransferase family protein [Flavobacteriales bacterium]
MRWNAMSAEEVNERINQAIEANNNYGQGDILGPPGTYLDREEFRPDAPFLDTAPFLKTLINNPNHIGCHTLGKESSPIFKGTQEIERELIELCAEEIFQADRKSIDGYVASGGTEANIEAMWIYRNYFSQEYNAKDDQIGVLFSEDTHYSITKACNLLRIKPFMLGVDQNERNILLSSLNDALARAKNEGIKYFIVIINLSTTMFGSVDEIEPIVEVMEKNQLTYKLHLDAAFGGFIYPFSNPNSNHHFGNPKVSSISIDGHKMLQTPYGTGMFLIRKGFMKYVSNEQAQYVPGLDYTLCGSRSGANAVVMWMVLMRYGSKGMKQKITELLNRTDYCCKALEEMGISYFRNPYINIIAIKAEQIPAEIAHKYELVADSYERPARWFKIVVMDHVDYKTLDKFLNEVRIERYQTN